MTKDEALKLALEALENPWKAGPDGVADAITAIKEALAQEQEPVAWRFTGIAGLKRYMTQKHYDAQTPEIKKWYEPFKCKNCTTPPQPEQEPVAWADLKKKAQQIVESKFLWKKFIDGTPLSNDIACWMADFAQQYATPPQRKPLPPQSPCEMTQAESKMFKLGWLECEAAHGIKEKT